MRRLIVIALCALCASDVAAQRMLLLGAGGTATVSDAAETTAFLARTSGLNGTHTNAYQALINGLVSDGVFAQLDCLWIFATQDSTTATLNLVSASFTVDTTNVPTWTADSGYGDSNTSHSLDSTFNPSTATTPHFTQNSAHISMWSQTGGTNANAAMGQTGSGNNLFFRYTDNSTYMRVNDNSESAGLSAADGIGHFLANRSGSTAQQGYRNGTDLGAMASNASKAVVNDTIKIGRLTASNSDVTHQPYAMASIGGSLTSGQVGNFYSRLRTYMTAVGVP